MYKIYCLCLQFFKSGEGTLPLINKWIQADCPARIDISGGWSDTPPITYEHGGAVIMVGLLVNEKVSVYNKNFSFLFFTDLVGLKIHHHRQVPWQ